MTEVTGFDVWYGESVRRVKSDDELRQAVKHSEGWDLYTVSGGTLWGNPFRILSGCGADPENISDDSAMAFLVDGSMPPEYANLRRNGVSGLPHRP